MLECVVDEINVRMLTMLFLVVMLFLEAEKGVEPNIWLVSFFSLLAFGLSFISHRFSHVTCCSISVVTQQFGKRKVSVPLARYQVVVYYSPSHHFEKN